MKVWKKFYQCDCGTEGIATSHEYEEDGLPIMDLAFFNVGFNASKKLSIKDKLRWIWHILIKGEVWTDMVILNKETAKELGEDLITWSQDANIRDN